MRTRQFGLLAIVLLALSACSCGGIGMAGLTQRTVVPYYPPDTAPSALDLKLQVLVAGNVLQAPSPSVTIMVKFSAPGHAIAFRDGETLACDGAEPVTLENSLINLTYPNAAAVADKPFACSYTSKAHTSTFQVLLLPTPQILSPTQGATVRRQPALLVTYQNTSDNAAIQAFSRLSASPNMPVGAAASGSIAIDTTNLNAGPGEIYLQESPIVPVLATGDFHTFTVEAHGVAEAQVIWV
jgi:hypothetical protein